MEKKNNIQYEGPDEHSPESIFEPQNKSIHSMKQLLEKTKLLVKKLTDLLSPIAWFFVDCWGWLVSLWIYCFRSIERPGIFFGYSNYRWASRYADKRTKKWKPEWDQSGKQQGTFPIDDLKLIVCSKLELESFKKKGLVNKNLKPRKSIKKSYYTTAL